jgi:hypothetical protein
LARQGGLPRYARRLSQHHFLSKVAKKYNKKEINKAGDYA